MNLPEICIRRPVMTTLLMLSFIVVGIFGYRLLPVSALPRVDYPTIVVSGSLPGASPESMASSVATPLEKQFATIPGVSSIISTSGLGKTSITLQFDLNRDIDGAALDVQSAMTTAAKRLPIDMTTPPSFRKVNPADQPVLFLGLRSDTLPMNQVDEYAETLIGQRISTLPGIAQVLVFGAQKFAVRVQADPHAMAAAGVSMGQLQSALAAVNSDTPVGQINGSKQSATIRAPGQLKKAEEYRPVIVAYRNGNPITIGDVAKVVDGVEDDQVAAWFNGSRSILLAIFRQPDANTIDVVDSVKALVPTFRAQIPASVDLSVMFDRSVSIRQAVEDVQFTLILTVGLVVLVIFLFLRNVTATLIPALALPISVVGTFGGMYLMGYSIDNLSLLALTLSVGFVVDDAIVMLENIVRHIEDGMKPFDAALKGSREIGFTILSITFSLLAVFIPVLFMGGIVGRLFREFAVTISMTILISGFVSLTLTPMLASRLLRSVDHNKKQNVLFRWSEGVFDGMLALYLAVLRLVLRFRFATLMATFVTLAITAYLYAIVPKGFFPIEDTGQIYGKTEASQDISFDAMALVQKQAADVIAADPAVDLLNSSIGVTGSSTAINQGSFFIALKPMEVRKISASEVIQRLRPQLAKIPGINTYLQPVQNINVGGRLAKSLYQYTVQGTDLQEVQHWSPLLEEKLRGLPGLQDVSSDLQISSPQAYVDIDRQKAATLGVSTEAIQSTLYSAFGSRQVSTIYTPSNEYEVILELDPRYAKDIQSLSSIYVPSSAGGLVPLDAVVHVVRTVGPSSVDHQGALPSVTLSFNLRPGTSLGDAVQSIQEMERGMNLPATINTSFQGTAQVFQDSLRGQGLLLLAAVFVIYVVLGILYESFIHPVTILSGLPSAGIGALLTLMLFRMDLTVIAIIGIIMLIGIVKKNAIMMIDFALEQKRLGEDSPERAIYEACRLRFRPIMMTTMAAIMGTLPIALGVGAGSELRRPLGVAVVGGLVISQLLTLFITPVVYLYLERAQRFLSRHAKKRRAPEGPAVAEAGD